MTPTDRPTSTPPKREVATAAVRFASDSDVKAALDRAGFTGGEAHKQAAAIISKHPEFSELLGSQMVARARLYSYRGRVAARALEVLAEAAELAEFEKAKAVQ